MKNNIQKFLLSFCIILFCVYTLPTEEAYALKDSTFGELMGSALEAVRITAIANGVSTVSAIEKISDFLTWPYKVENNNVIPVLLSNDNVSVNEYLDRSTITIRPNTITIDGVPYTNIWLSHDAAEAFRINAYDFITAWNIASESNGTFADGEGYFEGLPLFNINGVLRTQSIEYPATTYADGPKFYRNGTISAQTYVASEYSSSCNIILSSSNLSTFEHGNSISTWPLKIYFYLYNNSIRGDYRYSNFSGNFEFGGTLDLTPFEFEWIAEDIPGDEVLPSNYGLNFQVPTYSINNWLIDYGDEYTNYNIQLNTTDTDLMVMFDDLIDLVYDAVYDTNINVNVDFNPEFEPGPTPTPTPTPPPEPTPPMPSPTPATDTNLIADTPWALLESWLQNIRDILRAIYDYVKQIVEYYLENIHADLFFIEQKLDEIIEKLEDVGEDIANKLSLIYADIGDITVDIGSFLDDFIIDLEQAPIKLANKTIDILKLIFLPVLTRLRNALGIWHYVTEWISSISAPFSYFINILSSAFPAAMTPIYACVAGTLCILVYKRFGR